MIGKELITKVSLFKIENLNNRRRILTPRRIFCVHNRRVKKWERKKKKEEEGDDGEGRLKLSSGRKDSGRWKRRQWRNVNRTARGSERAKETTVAGVRERERERVWGREGKDAIWNVGDREFTFKGHTGLAEWLPALCLDYAYGLYVW